VKGGKCKRHGAYTNNDQTAMKRQKQQKNSFILVYYPKSSGRVKGASKYSTLESDSRRRARESSKYVLKGNKLSYILLGEVVVKSQESADVK